VPTFGIERALSIDATARRPRVSKSGRTAIAVTYEQKPGNYSFAYVQAVSSLGPLLGSPAAIGNLNGPDLRQPDIDGDGTSFMMVVESHRAVGDRDVSIVQWNYTIGGWGAPVAQAAVAQTIGLDEGEPTVALLGPKYAVAWEQTIGFLSTIVQCRNFSRSGCIECGAQVTVPLSGSMGQPALASAYASGANSTTASLVFTAAAQLFPPSGDIYACQWSAHAPVTPTVLSPGCGYPTTLSLVGSPGIGNTTFGFSLSTTDAQATLGAFLLGLGLTTPVLPCGTCLIVNSVVADFAVLSGGAASYSLPVPCNQALIGFEIQAQAATFGSVQNVCPALTSMSLSQGIAFAIAE
jgi:hypothetical protein